MVLPIDDIVATNNEHTCDICRIGCSVTLLLVRTLGGFGGLLRLLEMALDDLVACFFSVMGEHI